MITARRRHAPGGAADAAHRHADRGRLLPARRHPAVRAAPVAGRLTRASAEPFKNLINAADRGRHGPAPAAGLAGVRCRRVSRRSRCDGLERTRVQGARAAPRRGAGCDAAAGLRRPRPPSSRPRSARRATASVLGALRTGDAGLAGWVVWPLGGVRRTARPAITRNARCAALHALTQRFTAEWADPPVHRAPPAPSPSRRCRLDPRPERACAPPGQRRQSPAPAVGPAAEGPDRRPDHPRCRCCGAAGRPERRTCGAASPTT